MNPKAYRKKIEKQVRSAAKAMLKESAGFRKAKKAGARMRHLHNVGQLENPNDLALARRIAVNRKEEPRLRAAALSQLGPLLARSSHAVGQTISLLGDPAEAVEVRAAALNQLKAAAFSVSTFGSRRPAFIRALRSAASHENHDLRQRALGVLARMKDAPTLEKLEDGLRDPAKALVPVEKALQLLSYDAKRDVRELLTEIVEHPPSAEARNQALRNLAPDASAQPIFENVLRDKRDSSEARIIAMAALQGLEPDLLKREAASIVADNSENEEVRAACLTAAATFGEPPNAAPMLQEAARQLQAGAQSSAVRRAARKYLTKRGD